MTVGVRKMIKIENFLEEYDELIENNNFSSIDLTKPIFICKKLWSYILRND